MITRDEALVRAQTWLVGGGVPYSQTKFKDGWRTDCSGYVSMVWNLSRNYWTGDLNTVGVRIPFNTLRCMDMLLFHDSSNPNNGSHVVLFDRWVNGVGGDFWIYEQTGAGKRVTRRITWKSTGRKNLLSYVPYKYENIVDVVLQPTVGIESDMKLVYAPKRGWARVGENFTVVDTQAKANVAAKVFNDGNAVILTDVEYDTLRSMYGNAA